MKPNKYGTLFEFNLEDKATGKCPRIGIDLQR